MIKRGVNTKMNRSLAPLIIIFGLVILATVFLSSKGTVKKPEEPSRVVNSFPDMRLNYMAHQNQNTQYSERNDPAPNWMPDIPSLLLEAQRDFEQGNYGPAEDKLRTIMIFEPDNVRAMTVLAYILYSARKFSESAALFKRIISISPYDASAMANLGAALARMNDFNEALKYSLQGFSIDPSSPVTLLNLAGIYAMSGNREKALEFFKKAADRLGDSIIPQAYDQVFDNIRDEHDFQSLVAAAEKNLSRTKNQHEKALNSTLPGTPVKKDNRK